MAVADEQLAATRDTLHRVATHVLARRRYAESGRFGLRASPGGIATPAFGTAPEVLRISGPTLFREVGGDSSHLPIPGSTLAELAGLAEADLSADFSAGNDTPDIGDVAEPLAFDPEAAALFARWYALAWQVLDDVVASLAPPLKASTIQLWPEHFDAGTSIDLGGGEGVNLGLSAGDSFIEEPYAYVGPWGTDRPGDQGYWNASFGAVVRRSAVVPTTPGGGNAAVSCAEFIREGLRRLSVEIVS